MIGDFILTDWDLNTASKIWSNEKVHLKISLEKGESQSLSVLKEKLVKYYIKNQLPDENAIESGFSDMVNARSGIQTLMKREQEMKRLKMLVQIKK